MSLSLLLLLLQIDRKDVMVDFIFAVDDPAKWHQLNIGQYPHHYSFLRHLGASTVAHIQDIGAGVYYNSLVEVAGRVSDSCVRYC